MNDMHMHCVKRIGRPKVGAGYCLTSHGYRLSPNGRYEHVVVAEKALGKPLPKGACVHHVNEIKTDNSPANLVVCPSGAYHRLIHQRQRALDACGNPNWRKCAYCGNYDEAKEMQGRRDGMGSICHRACSLSYAKARRASARKEVRQ